MRRRPNFLEQGSQDICVTCDQPPIEAFQGLYDPQIRCLCHCVHQSLATLQPEHSLDFQGFAAVFSLCDLHALTLASTGLHNRGYVPDNDGGGGGRGEDCVAATPPLVLLLGSSG